MLVNMQSNQSTTPNKDSRRNKSRKFRTENSQPISSVMGGGYLNSSLVKSNLPVFTLPSVQSNQKQINLNQTNQYAGQLTKVKENHICLYSSLDSFFKALKTNDLKSTLFEREFIRSQLNVTDAELNLILRNLEFTYHSRLSLLAPRYRPASSSASSITKTKLNNIKSSNAFNLGKDLVCQVIKEGNFSPTTPTTRTTQNNSLSSSFQSSVDIFRSNVISQQPLLNSHMQLREGLQSQSSQLIPPQSSQGYKRASTSQTPTRDIFRDNTSLKKASSTSHLFPIDKPSNQRYGGSLRLSNSTSDEMEQSFISPFTPTSSSSINSKIDNDDDDFPHMLTSVTPKYNNTKINGFSGRFTENSVSIYSDSGILGLEEGSTQQSISHFNTTSNTTSTYRMQTAKSKKSSTAGTRLRINTKESFFSSSDSMTQYNKPKLKAIAMQSHTDHTQQVNQEKEYLAMQYINSIDKIKNYREKLNEGIIKLKSEGLAMEGLNKLKSMQSKQYVMALGATKMFNIVEKIIMRKCKEGFEAWKVSLYIIKLNVQSARLSRLLSMRNLSMKLDNLMCTFLRGILKDWKTNAHENKQYLIARRLAHAATRIQTHIRSHLARKRVRMLRDLIKYQGMLSSLIQIQAFFRMLHQKWIYRILIVEVRRHRSATGIQKIARGRRSRKLSQALFYKKRKIDSAICIQCAIRRMISRKKFHQLQREKLELQSALRIQALVRRFLVRCRMYYNNLEQLRHLSAIKIQTVMRRKLVYKHLDYYKQLQNYYKYHRDFYASKIISIFRMFRVRRKFLLYMDYVKSERLKVYNAATKVNGFFRCIIARQVKTERAKERYESLVSDARLWTEHWSDNDNAWYYVNVQTGESAWEPPPSGYTTAHLQLMIATGELIDDPSLYLQTGTDANGASYPLCDECHMVHATKRCEKCYKNYCTQCSKSTHSLKSKSTHILTDTGCRDCSECDTVMANVFCKTCDEPYCGDCCTKVHAKGNRKFHIFSEMNSV